MRVVAENYEQTHKHTRQLQFRGLKMAFTKMKPLCKLERHTVDLSSDYKNDKACATFMESIALEQKQLLQAVFREANVFLAFRLTQVQAQGMLR